MCFSAQASFTATALLSVIGLLSLKIARKKSERLLALTPLIFAIQQFCEGVLWLTLPINALGLISKLSMYSFLFFALLFWPVWVPLGTYSIEKNSDRKKLLRGFVVLGIVTAALLLWFIPVGSISAHIVDNHLWYDLAVPAESWWNSVLSVMYLFSVAIPLFVSTTPYLWAIGIAVTSAYALTFLFYPLVLLSVWCFFAAIISSLILYTIYKTAKQKG